MATRQNEADVGPVRLERRVLVLAEADVARACAAVLSHRGLDVYAPRIDGPAETLAATLFPRVARHPPQNPLTRLLSDAYRVTTVSGRDAQFFSWCGYDAVVLQDLWLTRDESVPLGGVLAMYDYYLRGNFRGQKVVLITDQAFFSGPDGVRIEYEIRFRRMFDPNAQVALIPLFGASDKLPLERLANVLSDPVKTQPVLARNSIQVHDYRMDLLARAARVLNKPIHDFVADRARVFLIDDDPSAIDTARRYLGYTDDSVDARPAGVYVTPLVGNGESHRFERFVDLISWCETMIGQKRTDAEALIFVTDILFDRAWSFTRDVRSSGIDLIKDLRMLAERHGSPIGVIAFTGLDSPVITMAASNQGADWIVTKGGSTLDPGHGQMELAGSGLHRLMLTVAFFCFQKEFLRSKRDTESASPVDDAQHLLRVLPLQTISPHLVEEWRDTNYILSARAMFGHRAVPEEVMDIIRRVKARYAS